MGLRELVLETVELEDHGETAIEVGRYTLKADGGVVADQGKYIVVWKNDGGHMEAAPGHLDDESACRIAHASLL